MLKKVLDTRKRHYHVAVQCVNELLCVILSVIRLELNHQLMQYYTELDAVCLKGYEAAAVKTLPGLESSVDPAVAINGHADVADHISHLHINDDDHPVSDNGFFDILPVSNNCV